MLRTNGRRSLSRSTSLVSVLLSGALALSACSGGSDESESAAAPSPTSTSAAPTPSDTKTADGTTLARRWPLTGRMSDGDIPTRRALVVKIENTHNSRPQIGLGQADLVVQELVEGGLTRLAAFYYSHLPRDVGPVRSMRTSDIPIVRPANALLVASGGAPPTVNQVRRAGIPMATEGAPGYHRVGNRPAPYNLFMHLDRLGKARARGDQPPDPYLPWGKPSAPRDQLGKGKPAGTINARFSGGTVNTWTYRAKSRTYDRSIDHTGPNGDFKPRNVLALRVRITDAGYPDPAGNPVPETVLKGKGPATLFRDGRAFEAQWHKPGPKSALRLTTKGGKAIRMPPGRTWIELVPRGGGDLSYRR